VNVTLTHRRYIDHSHAHYAGDLVDGAFVLGLFGDLATDICLHLDGDEGLFASYSSVTFHHPLRAGDVLEATGTVTRVGNRSRDIEFSASIIRPKSAERVLAVSALGTVVVPG
jgi:3-aminobutyryl-CoA ammonia-lyase